MCVVSIEHIEIMLIVHTFIPFQFKPFLKVGDTRIVFLFVCLIPHIAQHGGE